MNTIFFKSLIVFSLLLASNAYSQNAGYFAGGFADGLNRGMASAANSAAISQAITQQRLENRKQYGTREIQQMNLLEKDADNRLRDIFRELSNNQYRGEQK